MGVLSLECDLSQEGVVVLWGCEEMREEGSSACD